MDAAKSRQLARAAVERAKAITSLARHEELTLTDAETAKVKSLMNEAEGHVRSAKMAEAIGERELASEDAGTGWKAAAQSLIRGDRLFKGRLTDFLRFKDVTHAEVENDQRSAGIRPLLEDRWTMAGFFPRQNLAAGALSVSDYFIASRGVASGTVERDPLNQGEKAVVDVVIDLDSADARQFAAIVDDPEPAL